ncbi:MAG: hypothetical protein AB8G22_07380 [Saprospiraceae bacterium]
MHFKIRNAQEIDYLRFDPCFEACIIKNVIVKILPSNESILLKGNNSWLTEDTSYYFNKPDPQLIYQIDPIESSNEINVQVDFWLSAIFDQEASKLLDYNTAILEINQQLQKQLTSINTAQETQFLQLLEKNTELKQHIQASKQHEITTLQQEIDNKDKKITQQEKQHIQLQHDSEQMKLSYEKIIKNKVDQQANLQRQYDNSIQKQTSHNELLLSQRTRQLQSISTMKNEITAITNSWSYRLGFFLTKPIRIFINLLK